jgi:hypothetical protein
MHPMVLALLSIDCFADDLSLADTTIDAIRWIAF